MQPVPPTDIDVQQPLSNFSMCHAGIVSQLHACVQLPALLEAGARARSMAQDMLKLFEDDVLPHHADEEKELFPAVVRSAQAGEEATHVEGMVRRLVAEHRSIERLWAEIAPSVRAAVKHGTGAVDDAMMSELVTSYLAHAGFEEQQFLPLAQKILSRNDNHMMALGLALHLRHVRIPGGAAYI